MSVSRIELENDTIFTHAYIIYFTLYYRYEICFPFFDVF